MSSAKASASGALSRGGPLAAGLGSGLRVGGPLPLAAGLLSRLMLSTPSE